MFSLITFLLLSFVSSIGAKSCTFRAQCLSVTENLNYVDCVDGTCECLTDFGFSGNASITDKCICESPKMVYTKFVAPHLLRYCVNIQDAVACDKQKEFNAIMEAQTRRLYDNMIWPTCLELVQDHFFGNNTLLDDLMDENARGRSDPYGEFDSRRTLLEVYYGTVSLGQIRVINTVYKKLVTQDNTIAVRVDLFFGEYPDSESTTPTRVYNVTQTAFIAFDPETHLIVSIESTNHNLGKASDTPKSPQVLADNCFLIMNIANCNGTNDPSGFYANATDCYEFMDAISYGTFDDLRTNSVNCRLFHALLAVWDPELHCPHTGKTGGGKCYDVSLEDYYTKDY
jgi:hypothetical protein